MMFYDHLYEVVDRLMALRRQKVLEMLDCQLSNGLPKSKGTVLGFVEKPKPVKYKPTDVLWSVVKLTDCLKTTNSLKGQK